ncbi:hypothetical protein ACFQ7N_07265 [Streptomyces niveus]|uniref:hypothetical protein n=1 Tax=Streptomyces niveus TaxID=193462 RepID=UPI003676847C
MEARESETVQDEVEKTSSRILEMMALKGKVTDTGAMVSRCSDYDPEEEIYRARQPWSVYDLPVSELEKAIGRLREELPKAGWKIVKDGVDGTAAKSQQIVAESKGKKFAADIRLMDRRKYSDSPSLIMVAVESACYKEK